MTEGDGSEPSARSGLTIDESRELVTSAPGDPRASPFGRSPEAEPRFREGLLIAARYRVVRFLARGGMGEVYEVEDLELGERIALKTLRGERAGDGPSIERFKRELSLARQVSHSSVCRLFDVGFHLPGKDSAEPPTVFLTMELLNGETLAARLDRLGRLSPDDALSLLRPLAAGLAAAHRAGVVHRDFKSQNVLVVPSGTSERVVITDFGLARANVGVSASSLTQTGTFLGSPAYMAPEQVEGGEATPRSDLYSFALVAYELVTGTLPFLSETPLATAVKRLKESPASPRSLVPDLPMTWEASLLKALSLKPEDRHDGPEAFVRALAPPSPRKARKRRQRLYALGVLALAGATGVALWWRGQPRPGRDEGAPATALNVRRGVVVLPFRNTSAQPSVQWLSQGLPELLGRDLVSADRWRRPDNEELAEAERDLSLPVGSGLDRQTLQRMYARLGTDLVVSGAYTAVGGEASRALRVDVQLQDVRTGDTVASATATGPADPLPDLVSRLTQGLRDALNEPGPTAAELGVLARARPRTAEGLQALAEGMLAERQGAFERAREAYSTLELREPGSVDAPAGLARVEEAAGQHEAALEASKRAFERSGAMSRRDRLWLEARLRTGQGEPELAQDLYRALATFYPDELAFGLRLGDTQLWLGHMADARRTVARLRELPSPLGDDPRTGVLEARTALAAALPDRALALAQSARKTAEARVWPRVAAAALQGVCEAQVAVGMLEPARASCEQAHEEQEKLGDTDAASACRAALVQVELSQGQVDRAQAAAETGADPAGEGGIVALRARAQVERATGALEAAVASLEKAREAARARHSAQLTLVLGELGTLQGLRGEVVPARATFEEALAAAKQGELPGADARAQVGLAWLDLLAGDVRTARERAGLLLATALSDAALTAAAHRLAAELAMALGDAAAAKREALLAAGGASSPEHGTPDMWRAQLLFARAALASGDAAGAGTLAQSLVERFAAAGWVDEGAQAKAMVLEAGAGVAAMDAVNSEQLALSTQVQQMSAAATVVSRKEAPALTEHLGALIPRLAEPGLTLLRLQAELARASLDKVSGRRVEAMARAAAVNAEAREHGLVGLARRADGLRGR